MKQATAIGASLMTSRISRIVTSNRPSKPRCSARAFGVSVSSRPMPKNKAKNITDRMALFAAHHLDEVVGDDADEGVDARRLLGAGLDDLAGAARPIAASICCGGRPVDAGAGLAAG